MTNPMQATEHVIEEVIDAERDLFLNFDPRHFIEEYYRMADGVLAAQRTFVLRIVDAMSGKA